MKSLREGAAHKTRRSIGPDDESDPLFRGFRAYLPSSPVAPERTNPLVDELRTGTHRALTQLIVKFRACDGNQGMCEFEVVGYASG